MNNTVKAKFFICERCNKKLIERKENGLWHFVFGKYRDKDGNLLGRAPVEMYVYGSIKLKCLRRGCDHWNVLNFFPFRYVDVPNDKELDVSNRK